MPLDDANSLDVNSNVEDQDYFAVQQLIRLFDMDKSSEVCKDYRFGSRRVPAYVQQIIPEVFLRK